VNSIRVAPESTQQIASPGQIAPSVNSIRVAVQGSENLS
jgi:hypothetical protein